MKFSFVTASSILVASLAASPGAYSQTTSTETQSGGGFGGFLGKLKEIGGTVVENMGKRVDVNITTEGISTNVQNSESKYSTGSNNTNSQSEQVYRTIDGSPPKLKNIFNDSNKEEVSFQKKDMGWPRVAVSFEKWGPKLKCWQGRIEIWTSPKNRTSEDFEACDVRYPVVDDMGLTISPSDNAYLAAWSNISGYAPNPYAVNTGESRTAGPNPPLKPLSVFIAQSSPHSDIKIPFMRILVNIVVYSGFTDQYVFSTTGGFGKNKLDGRLWFYKFNLDGKVN